MQGLGEKTAGARAACRTQGDQNKGVWCGQIWETVFLLWTAPPLAGAFVEPMNTWLGQRKRHNEHEGADAGASPARCLPLRTQSTRQHISTELCWKSQDASMRLWNEQVCYQCFR